MHAAKHASGKIAILYGHGFHLIGYNGRKLVKGELPPQDLAISYHGQEEDGFYHAEKDNCMCLIKRVEVSKGLALEE